MRACFRSAQSKTRAAWLARYTKQSQKIRTSRELVARVRIAAAMDTIGGTVLVARFLAAALQLALSASALRHTGWHVAAAMPRSCVSPGGGCHLVPALVESVVRKDVCLLAPSSLGPACSKQWQALERAFVVELTAALGLLAAELALSLTGLRTFRGGEALDLFIAIGHVAGCGATAVFLISGAACGVFHVIFALCVGLPFCCELAFWLSVFQGGSPTKFKPPEGSTD